MWRRSRGGGAWGPWARSLAADGPLPVSDGGTGAADVAGALESLGLSDVASNAPYVGAPTTSAKIRVGSIVRTVSSMYMQVLSGAEVRSLIGRAPNWSSGDFAAVVNGDEVACKNQVHVLLNDSTDAVDARVRGETGGDPTTGAMRFNYLIFAR